MKFKRHFVFSFDSLERVDARVEFGRSKASKLHFFNGYCGTQFHTLNGAINPLSEIYKLIFTNMEPWDPKRGELADPKACVGVTAVAGQGAIAEIGLSSGASVVMIGDALYKRLTLADIGRTGASGLYRQSGQRRIWFLRPIETPQQSVLDVLLKEAI